MSKVIRVFSGNLWFGRACSDALTYLIRDHEIDVFCCQELGFENAEAIASELPHGCLEPHETFQGMGIALRRPAEYSHIPLDFRPARRVALDPNDWPGLDRPLDLVNVHFQAPHSLRPFPPALIRRRQMRGLERYFADEPSDARLVVGDYNSTPLWPLYRRMARHLSDGAVMAAQRDGSPISPTWGRRYGSPRRLRIDHAMVRGLVVERFRVVEIPGSDHSGLLFDCIQDRPSADRVGLI